MEGKERFTPRKPVHLNGLLGGAPRGETPMFLFGGPWSKVNLALLPRPILGTVRKLS